MTETKTETAKTFEKWMEEVDEVVAGLVGCSTDDLVDWGYWDAYDAGESPKNVASDVLYDNGWEG